MRRILFIFIIILCLPSCDREVQVNDEELIINGYGESLLNYYYRDNKAHILNFDESDVDSLNMKYNYYYNTFGEKKPLPIILNRDSIIH